MAEPLRPTPTEIRRLRGLRPEMRERDFARIHGLTEAELVAAWVGAENTLGHAVTALRPDVEAFLEAAPALGEVMALTRNESAVHEKIGPFEEVKYSPHASLAVGDQIDLRIFPRHWVHAFAVEKTDKDGTLRRSIQFFDAAGDASFKLHARPATDLAAWARLVGALTHTEQSDTVIVEALPSESESHDAASPEELRARWEQMTDTHQFFPMLRELKLTRRQALHRIDSYYAWQLDPSAQHALFSGAVEIQVPIMVFVGSRGCIQIHSAPITNIATMGPWLNIMDPTFHLHLRLDQIAELWAVRKPTKDGHVTSVEALGADGQLIIQCFGQRHEGVDERPDWRALVESLPLLTRSDAA
jgi:putative hemin transport protein